MFRAPAAGAASLVLFLACVGTVERAEATGTFGPKKACAADLASCPKRGCTEPDTPDALVNETKRTKPPGGTAVQLTFEDFGELQTLADGLVGQGDPITAAERASLKNLALPSGTAVSEGDLVELRGFVIQDSPRPKPAGPESVNCRLSKAANNDIHIPIVEEADGDEFGAIVVEMIPQGRHAKWNSKNLKRAAKEDRPVIIRGQLFYDNKHKVNGDADKDNGEPKRFSLWEIHPVTEFWVCIRADRKCGDTLAKKNDWKALKDF